MTDPIDAAIEAGQEAYACTGEELDGRQRWRTNTQRLCVEAAIRTAAEILLTQGDELIKPEGYLAPPTTRDQLPKVPKGPGPGSAPARTTDDPIENPTRSKDAYGGLNPIVAGVSDALAIAATNPGLTPAALVAAVIRTIGPRLIAHGRQQAALDITDAIHERVIGKTPNLYDLGIARGLEIAVSICRGEKP